MLAYGLSTSGLELCAIIRKDVHAALGSHIKLQLAETPHCPLSGC